MHCLLIFTKRSHICSILKISTSLKIKKFKVGGLTLLALISINIFRFKKVCTINANA